ncbi:hypothetical protein NKH77_51040 [Streptomyces sp. M19]
MTSALLGADAARQARGSACAVLDAADSARGSNGRRRTHRTGPGGGRAGRESPPLGGEVMRRRWCRAETM